MSLRILYLGKASGTSLQRADALKRLGHEVHLVDPYAFLPSKGLTGSAVWQLIYNIGGQLFEPYVYFRLLKRLKNQSFDIIWVDSGELLGSTTIHALHSHAPKILNYNHDDPFGERDKRRFSLYRSAIAKYNLLAVVREPNIEEAIKEGAKQVMRVFMAADEVYHAPLALTKHEQSEWTSDAVFIGTWMPERGPFLNRLIELGVPLKIYGDRWHKAKEWRMLKKFWAGPSLHGADYVKAIQCAKVCIGLLSQGNRDLHTTRSTEIPFIGGVLCAERTTEHESMYCDGEEAVFWRTAEECAEKCFWLLANPNIRERISKSGQERCIANGMQNEAVIKKILDVVFCP